MKLKNFSIENYRSFKSITIDLADNLTLIVGKNGAGKTTILDAIGTILRTVAARGNTISIPELYTEDINDKLNNSITFSFEVLIHDGSTIQQSINFPKSNDGKDSLEYSKIFSLKNDLTKYIFDDEKNTLLPYMFAYYSAQRCLPKNINSTGKEYDTPKAIFESGFTPSIDFSTSLAWFDAKDAEEARLRSKKRDFTLFDPELNAVRDAITRSFYGDIYEFPHMDGTPPQLYITHKMSGQDFKVTQLSEGYRTMLALVMDLARRMAAAKLKIFPDSTAPALEAPGIVLIDEIELHLHPAWQQTVIPTLMKIFPNIQFIITTHSPQVVSSVKPEHILIIDQGLVIPTQSCTYGAETNAILRDIFGVTRPPNDATEKLTTYLNYINSGKGTSKKAKALRAELELLMRGDPTLETADRMLLRKSARTKRTRGSNA